jgi:predicted ArsR family transcriptional regulator
MNKKQQIVDLVRAQPGISSQDISKTLGITRVELSAHTSYLRDVKNQIYNQGKNGRSFLWYPVTAETEDQIPFIHEARAILKDLQQTPVAHRERRLAKLLSEREASREKHIL